MALNAVFRKYIFCVNSQGKKEEEQKIKELEALHLAEVEKLKQQAEEKKKPAKGRIRGERKEDL